MASNQASEVSVEPFLHSSFPSPSKNPEGADERQGGRARFKRRGVMASAFWFAARISYGNFVEAASLATRRTYQER
jgi:hypothetical protein